MPYNKENGLYYLKENYNDLLLNLSFNKEKKNIININDFEDNIFLNLNHIRSEHVSLIINVYNNNLNIFEYFSDDFSLTKKIDITININKNCFLNYMSIYENNCDLKIKRTFELLSKTKLEYMCGYLGSNTISKTQVNIKEEYSRINSKTFMISTNKKQQKHTIDIRHLAKRSYSEMKNYGVVLNDSIGEFENIGFIQKGCCDSNAQQESKIITLGNKSQANVHPILLIDEYDVVAGHAGSVGKVSKEQLFYLMSRGLSKEDAYILIIEGFFKPLLNNIKEEKIKIKIEKIIKNKILKG